MRIKAVESCPNLDIKNGQLFSFDLGSYIQPLPSVLHYTLAAHLSNVNACGSGKGGLVPIKWDVLNMLS